MTEALAELAAVDADVKVWRPMGKAHLAPTLYVNAGRVKLAEIWVSPAGYVQTTTVWHAIAAHINAR